MRTVIPSAAAHRAHFICKRQPCRLVAAIIIAGLAGGVLSSCSKYDRHDAPVAYSAPARIPLPKRALLETQPEPNCGFNAAKPDGYGDTPQRPTHERVTVASLASSDRQGAPLAATAQQSDGLVAQSDPNTGLSQRIKLEYERDCYRRAEMRARDRLQQLQKAVGATARAVKRAERSAP